nr:hypothetical protein [Methylovulum sp.]
MLKAAIISFVMRMDAQPLCLHGNETIGPGLLAKILRDCDLTRDQLQKLL